MAQHKCDNRRRSSTEQEAKPCCVRYTPLARLSLIEIALLPQSPSSHRLSFDKTYPLDTQYLICSGPRVTNVLMDSSVVEIRTMKKVKLKVMVLSFSK